MQTLGEMLATVARDHSTRVAIVERDLTLTYAALEDRAGALARRLYALGIREGDRVGLFLPNGADFVLGYFASAMLGAISVPLNHSYQMTELRYFLDTTGASILLTSRALETLSRAVLSTTTGPCKLLFVEDAGDAPPFPPPKVDPDSPAMYQFSSGSTGTPKRIARTHAQLLHELDSLVVTLGITSEDRFLGVAPFSHVNGLMRTMLTSLRAGASLYPLPDYERRAVAAAIEGHHLTVFIGIPFMFIMLAKANFHVPPRLSSLRLCISASAAMPARYNHEFYERFGFYVRQLYGSTETGTISVNLEDDIAGTLESIGRPIAGVEVDLLDEHGKPADADGLAEFAIRSNFAITAYEGIPDQSAFKDGYFLSGDLGRRDRAGRLYLAGRKKFFINRGGFKIDPREVEEILEQHLAVEEAVVVGVPSRYGDEKVKAVVVLRGPCTEEELVWFCGGKIAAFKIPALIEFRTSLPRTPTGKVQRRLLID